MRLSPRTWSAAALILAACATVLHLAACELAYPTDGFEGHVPTMDATATADASVADASACLVPTRGDAGGATGIVHEQDNRYTPSTTDQPTTTRVVSFSNPVHAGATLIACSDWGDGDGSPMVSDSFSGNWLPLNTIDPQVTHRLAQCFFVIADRVLVDAVTFRFTTSLFFDTVIVEYTGLDTSSLPVVALGSGDLDAGALAQMATTAAVAVTRTPALVFAFESTGQPIDGGTYEAVSPFVIGATDGVDYASLDAVALCPGSYVPSVSFPEPRAWVMISAVFPVAP